MFHELNGYKAIAINIKNCNSLIKHTISVTRCTFKGNSSSVSTALTLISINIILCNNNLTAGENFLILQNCLFRGNIYEGSMIKIYTLRETESIPIETQTNMILHIIGCSFQVHVAKFIEFYGTWLNHPSLLIDNTSFVKSFAENEAIVLSHVKLVFKGSVTFSEIRTNKCLLRTNSDITFYSYIEFSNIITTDLIYGSSCINFNIMENAYIKMTDNKISGNLFYILQNRNRLYDFCHFQFYKISNTNTTEIKKQLIEITSKNKQNFGRDAGNINCKWYQDSQYYHSGLNPLEAYSMHFKFINSSNKKFQFTTGPLCKCQDYHKNCYINLLDPIYPGQTLKLTISLNYERIVADKLPISVKVYDNDLPHTICQVSSLLEAEQEVYQNCTEVTYNILSENAQHCKLILYNVDYDFPMIYYIKLLNCPAGFSYSALEKKCICDNKLHLEQLLPIKVCNINEQTIPRPANSWISATIHNNSYTYHVSLHCPFHYCLPHSSYLNFSTPNSQCQFNRSGILCGHCKQGLSTVFSSSHCKTCSNIYLLLIIPIIVVGFVLVVILFLLNLTVTNGAVNGFILYANIISINTPILFPNVNHFTPAYTFISLANLDLGIQTCFYNGMDDYAKMWLQLAFPFYLIFIATLIIITSRYSTTIQRLTARRALPVLATLFLLSYTKILRIVSSVLFFYSTIIHLPSKHTTLVWSVDANVPLFGVRFTILFIVCLILFLILVPFNVILLFTRTLSRFRFINRFKPLLDAYQGPYKISYYYYTGVQLLIRVVFFALSSLERNINLVLSAILLSIIIGIHGIISPLQNKVKNSQEMLYLINLQILFVVALYDQQVISPIVFNILFGIAAFHFVLIIMYHIFTYSCNNKIKATICSGITTLSGWMTACRIHSKSYNNRRPVNDVWESNTRNEIPEAVNYHQYRETLLNEHY